MTEASPTESAKSFNGLSGYLREHLLLSKTLITALLAGLSVAAYLSGIFDAGDRAFWDFCFRHRPAQFTSPKIIIVEINEDAIRSVGRWPWDREWHATLIQALKDFGARAVALDMLFSEQANPRTDELLSKVIQKSGLVFLPLAYEKVDGFAATGPMRSLPSIARDAAGEGHTHIEPDRDGVLRQVHAYLEDQGTRRWQLGILLALRSWGLNETDLRVDHDNLMIPIPSNPVLQIPLDKDARMMVNWPARWTDSFRHVSYVDVINSYGAQLKGEKAKLNPEIFKDSICLVGITAAGLFDIYATPLETSYPTVGVTASVLNSLLERSVLSPAPRTTHILLMLIFSGFLLLIMLRAKYLYSFIAIGLLAAVYGAAAYLLFVYAHVVMSLVYPLLLILSGYVALAGYHQIVITIEKNRLLKLATTDPLTGLFNIAHFKRLLQAELQSTRLRAKKDICLVMADGDHFKKVNDTYGHAIGDDVLRGLADVLRSNCRALDVAARYGGEEFIIMLPGATLDAGLKVAEKIRVGVETRRYNLGPGGTPVTFTASFGVVAFVPGESMDDFLKRADEALYLAKKTGRNCVCTL